MKKIIALLLTLVLMLSLAACGGDETSDTDGAQTPTQSQDQTDDQPEESNPTEDETGKDEVAFTETVVVDNEECLIKITGIENDPIWGYSLKVYLENKSADQAYMFSVDEAAINGVQCTTLFATEVAAGKKANESVIFMDDMEEYDIGDYTDIELNFSVCDAEDWLADPVTEATAHVYPYGEDKAVCFVREAQDSDQILIDNEIVTAIVTGYEQDEIWGYTAKVYLVNKSDKDLMFSVSDAAINGFMADPIFAEEVSSGKCTFSSISWADTVLEENNITKIEEIEFKLQVYDLEDIFAEDVVNESVTLKP